MRSRAGPSTPPTGAALVSDSGGALFLLLRARGGDPPDADPVLGGWLWWELWTDDVDSAMDLYSTLAGYGQESSKLAGNRTMC